MSSLPTVLEASHVDVRVAAAGALVTSDWLLDRGPWIAGEGKGSFELFVAYTAPGLPAAFDAALVKEPSDGVLPELSVSGQSLATHPASSAPSHAAFSIGRPNLAGQVVRVEEGALREAFGASGRAFLRLRTVVRFEGGTRFVPSVVVRLATPRLGPVPVGAVTVSGEGESATLAAGATAAFCGLDGATRPLRLAQSPAPAPSADGGGAAPLAPFLTKLPEGYDLCVHVGAAPTSPPSPPSR